MANRHEERSAPNAPAQKPSIRYAHGVAMGGAIPEGHKGPYQPSHKELLTALNEALDRRASELKSVEAIARATFAKSKDDVEGAK